MVNDAIDPEDIIHMSDQMALELIGFDCYKYFIWLSISNEAYWFQSPGVFRNDQASLMFFKPIKNQFIETMEGTNWKTYL